MAEDLFGAFPQGRAINTESEREQRISFQWSPSYFEEFRKAICDVKLTWNHCRFLKDAIKVIPALHGVYCFTVEMEYPLPQKVHMPLYIGKAAPGTLLERYKDYLLERTSSAGRQRVVYMLNKYKDRLYFWWTTLSRIHVDTVEEHLLMCCHPWANTVIPPRERLWGKAFPEQQEDEDA